MSNLTEEQRKLLVPFGYSQLFADRDSIEEAFVYLDDIAKATDARPHVVTACMVYVNTLVKTLYENGQLKIAEEKKHDQASGNDNQLQVL